MIINSIQNIAFHGITRKVSNPIKPLKTLSCDTFQKTPSKNATYANQKKLDANNFDIASSDMLLASDLDLDKVIEISKTISNPRTRSISFGKNEYDAENAYVMRAADIEGNKALLLDKDLKTVAQEESYEKCLPEAKTVGGVTSRLIRTTTGKDFRNNTEFSAEYLKDTSNGRLIPLKEVKIKKDAQNRLVRTETAELSNVAGVYNVKYDFPNGKSRVLSKANYDEKTGHTLIQKDMRSSDMTRTQYRYEDDKNGNRLMEYKITSPGGKVLLKQSQTFEKISDNKFISSRNEKVYDIEMNDFNMKITDRNSKEATDIDLNTIYGKREKVIKALKTIPGDELMELAKRVDTFEGIEKSLASSCMTSPDMWSDGNITKSRLNVNDNPFIFLHELGHAIDAGGREFEYKNGNRSEFNILNGISEDKEFKNTFNKEKENFLKEFPEAQRSYLNYFIAKEAVEGEEDRGRKETIAETNGILNSYNSTPEIGMRTQYLQQHFPKTIAYLATKLTNNA